MLKDKRFFLTKDVNSAIMLEVPNMKGYNTYYTTILRDCNRQIEWSFSVDKKGLAKIRKVCDLFNSIRDEIEEKLAQ